MITDNPNNFYPPEPEGRRKAAYLKNSPHKILYELFKPDKPCPERSERVSSFIFYLAILFFIIGFNFSDVMVGNWYQQFLPPINNRPISDITFLDSLTGFAVTPYTANDTAFILKTTTGGNNWNRVFTGATNSIGGFNRVQFLNINTGFVCGNFLRKTVNGGINWFPVNTSGIFPENMYVISEDTIWLTDSDPLTGGVFFTSTGGASWQNQLNLGSQNPNHIYMYNGRIGFASTGAGLYKTINSGVNWSLVGGGAFLDMYFADSLTGWKNNGTATVFQKTTDGGLNWVTYSLPLEIGNILFSRIVRFDNVINDTIWGVGSTANTGSGNRGLIYRSTNSGQNWDYQVPDSININIFSYQHVEFTARLIGWAYTGASGVHTTLGGDPIWYTPVTQISTEVPKQYMLFQNYPNPFNPKTIIRFQIKRSSDVKITVFDIQGKEITTLINQKQSAGTYEVSFEGTVYSSGIYFYSLFADGMLIDTKKMILIK